MEINGFNYAETNKIWKKKITKGLWWQKILEDIAANISKYYNYCLENKQQLLYRQDEVRQIFLNKDTEKMQHFNNNRPITITCMLYRTLETIILKRMEEEEKDKRN